MAILTEVNRLLCTYFFCAVVVVLHFRSNFWIWILAGAAIFLILFLCQILGGPGDPTTLPSRSHSGGNALGSQFHFLRRGLNKWVLGGQGDVVNWDVTSEKEPSEGANVVLDRGTDMTTIRRLGFYRFLRTFPYGGRKIGCYHGWVYHQW